MSNVFVRTCLVLLFFSLGDLDRGFRVTPPLEGQGEALLNFYDARFVQASEMQPVCNFSASAAEARIVIY